MRGQCGVLGKRAPGALAVCLLALALAPGAASAPVPSPAPQIARVGPGLLLATAPRIPGLRFALGGRVFVTDGQGTIAIPADVIPSGPAITQPQRVIRKLRLLPSREKGGLEYRISRYTTFSTGAGRTIVRAMMDTFVPVKFVFTDRSGRRVDPRLLNSVTIKRSDGAVTTLGPKRLSSPVTVQARRIVRLGGAFFSKNMVYRIQSVLVGGNNLVNRAQQAFTPLRTRTVDVELLFYSARISARDRIFGYGIGSGIRLEYPDGRVEQHDFTGEHGVLLPALPRGEYQISVDAPGLSSSQPVVITRDQVVEIKVISYADIAFILGVLITLAGGLLVVGRGPGRGRRFGRPTLTHPFVTRDPGPKQPVDRASRR